MIFRIPPPLITRAGRLIRLALLGGLAAACPNADAQVIVPPIMRLDVQSARLPGTIGVPVKEALALTSTANLCVKAHNGTSVPAQFIVQSRWGGPATDITKPIKWLLVDFTPLLNTPGTYEVVMGCTGPATTPWTTTTTTSYFEVANATSGLTLRIPKLGDKVLSSLKLGGVEQLRAGGATISGNFAKGGTVTWDGVPSSQLQVYISHPEFFALGDQFRIERFRPISRSINPGLQDLAGTVGGALPPINSQIIFNPTGTSPETLTITQGANGPQIAPTLAYSAGTYFKSVPAVGDTGQIVAKNGQLLVTNTNAGTNRENHDRMLVTTGDSTFPVTLNITGGRIIAADSTNLRLEIVQTAELKSALFPSAVLEPKIEIYHTLYRNLASDRIRIRFIHNGPNGHGSQSFDPSTHTLIRDLALSVPTVLAGSGSASVLDLASARANITANTPDPFVIAGSMQLAVPEFAQTFPKRLTGTSGASSALRFEFFPDVYQMRGDYLFEGARSWTFECTLGTGAQQSMVLAKGPAIALDPVDLAATGAVRPALIASKPGLWKTGASTWAPGDFSVFQGQGAGISTTDLALAANRMEKRFASSFANEANDIDVNYGYKIAIPEYRMLIDQHRSFAFQVGWPHWGNLMWDDGWNNLHYDLPFCVLREYCRTGDIRALKIGGELARYQANWGTIQAAEKYNYNSGSAPLPFPFKGLNFYEQGGISQGEGNDSAAPSHSWSEGLWLWATLTGDPIARSTASKHAECAKSWTYAPVDIIPFYNFSSQSRLIGWPTLELIAAWRYTGNIAYRNKAREFLLRIVAEEQAQGAMGYIAGQNGAWGPYCSAGSCGCSCSGTDAMQWWQLAGYSMQAFAEYYRETGTTCEVSIKDYIVRVNNRLLMGFPSNPALILGQDVPGQGYLPTRLRHAWWPNCPACTNSPSNGAPDSALASFCLNSLLLAYRVEGSLPNSPYIAAASKVFRDSAFYRDSAQTYFQPGQFSPIGFSLPQYAGDRPKKYGQEGLLSYDFLAESQGAVVYRINSP